MPSLLSTLIRAVNGLIPHAYPGELGGTVSVAGQDVSKQPLRATSLVVGTVLQDPARQIVGATVESELAFGPEKQFVQHLGGYMSYFTIETPEPLNDWMKIYSAPGGRWVGLRPDHDPRFVRYPPLPVRSCAGHAVGRRD